MDDHKARSHMTIDRRRDSSLGVRTGHPNLSATDRIGLAERIALIDGVTRAKALQQMDEFMSTDLGAAIARPTEIKDNHLEGDEPTPTAVPYEFAT